MNHFARRMSSLQASEIREILKLTRRPEVISFAGGLPAPELFPSDELRAVADQVLRHEPGLALQYSPTEGDPLLRHALARHMNRRLGCRVSEDEILITTGSQQGLDLTGKVFLDEGDVVLCESPTYIGAIQAFTAYGPRFVEVPTDDEGMLIPELVRLLSSHRRIRLAYVVPDFQNPTGRSWSSSRRMAFMQLMWRHGIPVVEDCPYGQVAFDGPAHRPLKALDRCDQLLFLGTFSKILCPGLRIGWVAGPRHTLERYVLAKQGSDLHTSSLDQRLVARFLERGRLGANLSAICDTYRERRDAMLGALDATMPPGVRWTRPGGGLFVWLELPPGADARDLLLRCLEHDVAFVPGGSFFPNGGHDNTLRLNFSNMPCERIVEGVRRISAVLHESLTELAHGSAAALA
jgi:2-aminoadipate transaminase